MTTSTQKPNRYDSLDGLRAYSAVGIVLMHVLANGGYAGGGFVFAKLIPSFADLVFLFMVISGFSLCCGYYEKMTSGQLSLERFYGRRFEKIWPFFALLSLMELAISPSVGALCETLANLTLCFGLIPNANISVIGVGWFIGLVVVFYLLFPFVCYLLSDKKRAWLSLAVALLLHILCCVYFPAGRTSIAYSGVFFMAGGMLYLYRQRLQLLAQRFGWLLLAAVAGVLVIYYQVMKAPVVVLPAAVLITVYGLRPPRGRCSLLCNPVVKRLGDLSMEIYLCHMVVYRVLEKTGITRMFGSGVLGYVATAAVTLCGAVAFSAVAKALLSRLSRKK